MTKVSNMSMEQLKAFALTSYETCELSEKQVNYWKSVARRARELGACDCTADVEEAANKVACAQSGMHTGGSRCCSSYQWTCDGMYRLAMGALLRALAGIVGKTVGETEEILEKRRLVARAVSGYGLGLEDYDDDWPQPGEDVKFIESSGWRIFPQDVIRELEWTARNEPSRAVWALKTVSEDLRKVEKQVRELGSFLQEKVVRFLHDVWFSVTMLEERSSKKFIEANSELISEVIRLTKR